MKWLLAWLDLEILGGSRLALRSGVLVIFMGSVEKVVGGGDVWLAWSVDIDIFNSAVR